MPGIAARALRIGPRSARTPRRLLTVTKAPRQSRDAPILAELLELHAVARPRILDCTYGKGAIWGRLPIRDQVIKTDIRPLPGLDLVASWCDLPEHFAAGSLDVLVWDPIQVSDVGKNSQIYSHYVAEQNPVRGDDVTDLYPGFFDAAERIVRARTGIVLAKMVDVVHGGRYRWQVFALVAEAQRRGWTACQPKAFFNPSPVPIPGARRRLHTRNDVAYWLVLRYGPACHGPGRRLKHELICEVDGRTFFASRSDARTCPGGRCRQRRYRAAGEVRS